jgi:MFS transporter, SP family, solute carrier family 2 (facilitated glucose transporter), member 3
MFEGKYVAVAMSVSSQVNWACNFIIGLVFPYMNDKLGAFSFAPFALVLALTFGFAATVLPETQGTTPEELAAELTRTLSESVIYKPNVDSATQIDMEWRKAMEQLQEEEERERNNGTYDYGFKVIDHTADDHGSTTMEGA